MEIFPNVHEIKSVLGDRYLQQYLFLGDMAVLLDAGVAGTPSSTIFPYLEKLGLSPQHLSLVIALHPDVDHHGGLPALKDASPGTSLACHPEDLKLIEDPEYLYRQRYNFLAEDHDLGLGPEVMLFCPEGRKIEVRLSAGQTLQLAKDWRLHVWHVPGHSAGHLAIYDEKNRAAFTSDAVQGNGYLTIDGKMAFGPTYYAVEAYLGTIQFLENMPIEHIFSGHWPACHGNEVKTFLKASRDFVQTTDELLMRCFKSQTSGITLKQILPQLNPQLGDWPETSAPFLQFAIYGHLVRLQQRGVILSNQSHPVEWRLA